MQNKISLLFYPIVLLAFACKTPHYSISPDKTEVSLYKVKTDSLGRVDSLTWLSILPYKQQIDSLMSEVLISNERELQKQLPEGSLNNFMCDLLLSYMSHRDLSGLQPMVCLINYGGIRLPALPAGQVTVGKIYELMPFDNELVLLQINGEILMKVAEKIAAKGGESIGGMRVSISDKKCKEVFVQGQPVNAIKTYYLLTSDYVANGGDGYSMFKGVDKIIPLKVKLRDAMIDELRWMKLNNKNIQYILDERVQIIGN